MGLVFILEFICGLIVRLLFFFFGIFVIILLRGKLRFKFGNFFNGWSGFLVVKEELMFDIMFLNLFLLVDGWIISGFVFILIFNLLLVVFVNLFLKFLFLKDFLILLGIFLENL